MLPEITRDSHFYWKLMVRWTFILYMFFIFFGTSLPFRDKIEDISDVGSSNPVSQIVYSVLLVTSTAALVHRRKELSLLLKQEKWLLIFMAWCLLSILWSDFRWVSFKRFVQVMTSVTVCGAFLLHIDDTSDILLYLRPLLYVYIALSMASVLVIPGATDPSTGTWRGLATSKNNLGQAALISTIVFFISLRHAHPRRALIDLGMAGFSLVLLFGSKSMTSITTLLILALLAVILQLEGHFARHGFPGLLPVFVLLAGLLGGLSLYLVFPRLLPELFQSVGKNLTFTGRTDLWNVILVEVARHPFLGGGFQGFWVTDNPALVSLYKQFVWIPLQAHNGYLDILNEAGAVGLALLVCMVAGYYAAWARGGRHWTQYFLVAVLILNFQESTLFRPNMITGVFFILAYLTVHAQAAGLVFQNRGFSGSMSVDFPPAEQGSPS